MRILHITAMSPLSPNSGIPVVLRELTEEQNKIKNVESRVLSLCSEVSQINSRYFDFIKKQELDIYLDNFSPNIAVFHSFFHIEYRYVCKLLKKKGIPFIIEPHGSFGRSALKKSRIKKYIADQTVFRSLIHDSICYIFTSEEEKRDSAYRNDGDLLIPNGVRLDIIKDAKVKNKTKKPVFYFLGRYDVNHKGLDYLFDALDILEKKQVNLIINFYGTGTNEQKDYVNKRLSDYRSVTACDCGPIYGEDKKRALENSNILVLTSRYEGSPITVLDGLSYGNPCVVTPGTNVSEKIVDNSLGWKTELDAKTIANILLVAEKEYLDKQEEYEKNCKEYVKQNYSWELIATKSIELFERLI